MENHQLFQIYNQELPNSKSEGFTPIYRRKGQHRLDETPEESITTIRDMLKVVRDRYGSKDGLGEIIVSKEVGKNGEEVQKRSIRQHSYGEVMETAYSLGRYLHWHKIYTVEEVHQMKLIGIYSKNRYEWFISDWACALFGITSVPLYDTLGVENLTYCLNQTLITSIFVTSSTVHSLLKLKDLGRLKIIISYDPLSEEVKNSLKERGLQLLDFWSILKEGSELKEVKDSEVKIGPNDCYTFSYTSGTTGPPKGAMISNKNILAATNSFAMCKDLSINVEDRYLSYLPLPHLMERTTAMAFFYKGASIVISSGNILKIKEDWQTIRVTILVSVPRIFNKIVEGVKNKFPTEEALRSQPAALSMIRQSFGGAVRLMATGSAPTIPEVHSYMETIMGCSFLQGYGQTESSALVLLSKSNEKTFGDLTQICPGLELKLADIPEMKYTSQDLDQQGNPCPRGQIWKRGPQVFLGYYKQPEVTREAITEDGWFKSGDVAEIHSKNKAFKIIDRKKNIFKLQQGQYLAPDRIEGFYSQCSLVSEIFLHGDSLQYYAVAIVTPNKEKLEKLADANGIKGTFEELCADKALRGLFLNEMNAVGRREGLHGFELAKNVWLDTKGFLARGILTNTLKLIRFEARNVFKEQLKALYEEGELTNK